MCSFCVRYLGVFFQLFIVLIRFLVRVRGSLFLEVFSGRSCMDLGEGVFWDRSFVDLGLVSRIIGVVFSGISGGFLVVACIQCFMVDHVWIICGFGDFMCGFPGISGGFPVVTCIQCLICPVFCTFVVF